jgi:ubiquinone/menaquinone biosynthesis C-methylase UbiE
MLKNLKNTKDTGWGKVASWYKNTISNKYSYQKELLLPTLLKTLPYKKVEGKNILEIGCGTGMFLENYINAKKLVGVDLGKELLQIAENNFKELEEKTRIKINFNFVHESAENMKSIPAEVFDFVISVESLSNMENLEKVAKEVDRVLKVGGEFYLIINHPAFRIPQNADWYYDKLKDRQGRVVYKYKNSQAIKIDMNPGEKNYKNKKFTFTFHRPISEYINAFCKNGMNLNLCLEICSDKKSENGPRKKVEDIARAEIPMFLLLRFVK